MGDTSWRWFDRFSLNLATGELRRNGVPVALERQPALVLTRLVADAGQLVPRDALRRAVWPEDTHVDYDRGLNYCLRQLRLALGDDARAPRFIETVPRQGHRFIATLATAPAAPPEEARPRRQRRTIVAAAMLVSLGALVGLVERGPRNDSHHRAALVVARTLHAWLF